MEIQKAAIDMARRAGRILKENLGHAGRVEFKGDVNIVTEMDMRSEALIMGEIKKRFPGHGILTEESEGLEAASGKRWIIDPLDGTTNYSHGLPIFCVSIAFEDAGEVLCGVVYNPMLDELFTAQRGKGALLNGKRIKISKTARLDRSLIATGFPYDLRVSKQNNFDHFKNFSLRSQAIRRAGSAALDLCYVASGRFDGFWEMKLSPWDTAAASLIVTEAGGRVTDFEGNDFSNYRPECLASNGLIHGAMLDVLAGKS
ncbi:MAG: inositol monophosphatase family protein [Thermodesulfobacteriota bacterium]|nr:MAG: inositol monophosphatase family protein [Thermodesulfobacteriota bacterium]